MLAARKAHGINDFEPRQGHLLKWPKGQLITSLVPSFDERDVQLKTGKQLQGRVVGRVQTNCCMMVTFDREITAATDTVKGELPARDGAMPGLDKGKKVGPTYCIHLFFWLYLACISARSPQVYVRVSALQLKKLVPQGGYSIHAGLTSHALLVALVRSTGPHKPVVAPSELTKAALRLMEADGDLEDHGGQCVTRGAEPERPCTAVPLLLASQPHPVVQVALWTGQADGRPREARPRAQAGRGRQRLLLQERQRREEMFPRFARGLAERARRRTPQCAAAAAAVGVVAGVRPHGGASASAVQRRDLVR